MRARGAREQCPSGVHPQYGVGGASFVLLNGHSGMFPRCFELHGDLITADNLLDVNVGEVVHLAVEMQIGDVRAAFRVRVRVRCQVRQ